MSTIKDPLGRKVYLSKDEKPLSRLKDFWRLSWIFSSSLEKILLLIWMIWGFVAIFLLLA